MVGSVEDDTIKEVRKIVSVLSYYDALKIFLECIEGIEADTNASDRLGLTKKQYYTRLKQLVDAGLIEKSKGKYVHTTLGKLIYDKAIRILFEHVKNSKKLLMVDVLKSSGKFDMEEIYRLLQIKENYAYERTRLITSYDEFVRAVIATVDDSSITRVYYATRRLDTDILNKVLSLYKKGIDVKILADKRLIDNEDGLMLASKELTTRFKVTNIPFCFIVSSNELFIELVNTKEPNRFYACISIRDEKIIDQVKELFDTLFNAGGGI